MTRREGDDRSNGYQEHAAEFISGRSQSDVGVASVRAWGRTLSPRAAVLDLGCGCGGGPLFSLSDYELCNPTSGTTSHGGVVREVKRPAMDKVRDRGTGILSRLQSEHVRRVF